MLWLVGLGSWALGCVLSLLGQLLTYIAGRRLAQSLFWLGALLGTLGGIAIVVAAVVEPSWSHWLTVLAVLAAVVPWLVVANELERVSERLMFRLRRRHLDALAERLGPGATDVDAHAIGIVATHGFGERRFLVFSTVESLTKDGERASRGFLRVPPGTDPAVGESMGALGHVARLRVLGDGWWLCDVHPHPDWPEARRESGAA